MKLHRIIVALGTAVLALGSAASASATSTDVPPNDTRLNATTLSTPTTITQDTSGAATHDLDDQLAEQSCWSPVSINAGVWFKYTPATDGELHLSTSGSDYDARIAVFVNWGEQGAYPWICGGSNTVDTQVVAANGTHWILVYNPAAGGTGGNLVLNFSDDVPPIESKVTVDATATRNADGTLAVTGTAGCDRRCTIYVYPTVSQPGVTGSGGTSVESDGSTRSWSATVKPDRGTFRRGTAQVSLKVEVLTGTDFEVYTIPATIKTN
jgi:hypothetical protein